MVKAVKATEAGVQKKGPANKAIKKEKVAKPVPKNRVAVNKPAATKTAESKKAASKPVPKKQAPVKKEESASESEAELNESAEVAAVAEVEKPKRVQGVSVFVGNVVSNTKREHIIKLFAPHAKVLRVRFRKPNGGQLHKVKANTLPSLVAFVDVTTQEEAEAAAAALNQVQFRGNNLRVNLDKSSKSGSEKRSVFIGSLTYSTTDQQLQETFSCCGEIEYVRSLQNAKGCQGTAFVCFKDAASVEMALELNGGELNGRPMTVTKCRSQQLDKATKTNALKADKQAAKKQNGKSDKPQFTGAKVAGGKKPNKGKKGGLSGPKLLAKKVAPRPAKVTA